MGDFWNLPLEEQLPLVKKMGWIKKLGNDVVNWVCSDIHLWQLVISLIHYSGKIAML
jgi:hypothetical protein